MDKKDLWITCVGQMIIVSKSPWSFFTCFNDHASRFRWSSFHGLNDHRFNHLMIMLLKAIYFTSLFTKAYKRIHVQIIRSYYQYNHINQKDQLFKNNKFFLYLWSIFLYSLGTIMTLRLVWYGSNHDLCAKNSN